MLFKLVWLLFNLVQLMFKLMVLVRLAPVRGGEVFNLICAPLGIRRLLLVCWNHRFGGQLGLLLILLMTLMLKWKFPRGQGFVGRWRIVRWPG